VTGQFAPMKTRQTPPAARPKRRLCRGRS